MLAITNDQEKIMKFISKIVMKFKNRFIGINHGLELRRKTVLIIRFKTCSKFTEQVRDVVSEEICFNVQRATLPMRDQIIIAVLESHK